MTPSLLAAFALSLMLFAAGCTAVDPASGPPAPEPAPDTDSFTGQLQGGMMAIGGETTGWILRGEPAHGDLEVDVSAVEDAARRLDGQRVRVVGRIVDRQYVERGATPVLIAERIAPAQSP